MKTNSPSLRASRLPRLVTLGPYGIARDFWNDAGRLYLTSGGDAEHAEWTLLGEGLSIYPSPLWQTVTIDVPRMGGINGIPYASLDRLDGHSFAKILRDAGYRYERGQAWRILDLVKLACDREVAVSAYGVSPAGRWTDVAFDAWRRLGWDRQPRGVRHAFA